MTELAEFLRYSQNVFDDSPSLLRGDGRQVAFKCGGCDEGTTRVQAYPALRVRISCLLGLKLSARSLSSCEVSAIVIGLYDHDIAVKHVTFVFLFGNMYCFLSAPKPRDSKLGSQVRINVISMLKAPALAVDASKPEFVVGKNGMP